MIRPPAGMPPPPGETLEGWCVRHGLGRRSALICSKLRAHDVDLESLPYMTGDDLKEMGIPKGPAVTIFRNCIPKDWPAESRMMEAQLEAEDEAAASPPVSPLIDSHSHSPAAPVTSGRSLSFADPDTPAAAEKPALSDAQEADLASFCKLTAHVTGAAAAREAMHLAGWDLTAALNTFYAAREPTRAEDFIVPEEEPIRVEQEANEDEGEWEQARASRAAPAPAPAPAPVPAPVTAPAPAPVVSPAPKRSGLGAHVGTITSFESYAAKLDENGKTIGRGYGFIASSRSESPRSGIFVSAETVGLGR